MSEVKRPPKLEPAKYTWALQAYEQATHTTWNRDEVDMSNDVATWSKLSEKDRSVIAGILRGFSLIEQSIGSFWRRVPDQLVGTELEGVPEITAMCTSFAYQEVVHGYAYSFLESSLGLDSYPAFIADPVCTAKIDAFSNVGWIKDNIAAQLCLFSALGEGVSLYGSFAVLLDICRREKLPGIQQILSWSVRDELLHFESGIQIGRLISDTIDKDEATNFAEIIYNNEISFLSNCNADPIFELFVAHRVNEALKKLDTGPHYYDNGHTEVSDWFYSLVQKDLHSRKTTQHDFFNTSKNGSAYSKTVPSFELDLGAL